MSLKSYIIARLLLTIPMLFILVTLVFVVVRIIPGDPVLLHFGKTIAPGAADSVRHALGLDKPLYVQYYDYLVGLIQGDLGKSFTNYQPVSQEISSAFPATVELALYSIIIAIVIGTVFGVRASRKYDSPEGTVIQIFSIVSYCVPIFFLGLVMQFIFSVGLHLLPATGRLYGGYVPTGATLMGVHIQTGLYTIDTLLAGNLGEFVDAVKHLILPSVTLGLYFSGVFTRITRNNMLEALQQDFVRSATARGLKSRTVMYSYALRNALLPVLTVMGLEFAVLLGGAILTETTFAWNGLGSFVFHSIQSNDYTAIQGVVVFFGLLVAFVSLGVDILYAYLDPRIKY